MDDYSEVYENGQEISSNDGILLKKCPVTFLCEITHSTTGTLSLVHYLSNRLCIEWKPNDDYLIADADTQEQDDWSIVDTITKRQRTLSESMVFGSPPNVHTKEINKVERQSPAQTKSNCLRVRIADLKNIDVLKNGHIIRLINKFDGKVHSEYFFQNGNADGFVRTLQTMHCLQRSRHNKNQFEIVDNIEYDKEKLQKTFAELKIDDIKAGKRGWIPNMVLEHTMDFFAKVSDVYTMAGQSVQTSPEKSNHNSSASLLLSNEYEVLSTSPKPPNADDSNLPPRPNVIRGSPLSAKQWTEFMTEDGRISDPERVKEIIFRGGIEESLRCEVWKFLLDYFDWDMSAEQRYQHRNRKSQEYYKMKLQWLSMSQCQEKNFSDYRDRKCQIEKDVKRTDRTLEYFSGDDSKGLEILKDILMTYVMFNFDLGYVQGMSDLLAPILCVMKNESDAFWCFKGFMDIVDRNFDLDQSGMKQQLQDLNKLMAIANPRLYNYFTEHKSENMYFCFRWLLVWFKREFSLEDICELWEVLWTSLPCINFHLFVSVAILDDQQHTFIDRKYEFNEILKHVNELSLAIDLKRTLGKAEAIYLQIKVTEDLTDEIRLIIGEEPIQKNEKIDDEYENDNFDEIVTISKNAKEEIEIQKKIDEACDRSMYNSFY